MTSLALLTAFLVPSATLAVAHRGLAEHAPENTLPAFAACLDLELGLELDVRRTRDGHLVVLHDAALKRTTTGKGKVAETSLAELRKLDAGAWFDPAFAGQRVPTLDEVFTLIKERNKGLVLMDLKVEGIEADVVRLANRHGILARLVFIGTTIGSTEVRRVLRQADPAAATAALAQAPVNLPAALAAQSNWIYIRFVPTAAQVREIHRAGKKVVVVGTTVMGHEPDNWRKVNEAGADAMLTDHPLTARKGWRGKDGQR